MSNFVSKSGVPATPTPKLFYVYDSGRNPGECTHVGDDCKLIRAEIDNSSGDSDIWLKGYNRNLAAGTPVLESSVPEIWLYCAAGATLTYAPGELMGYYEAQANWTFSLGLWYFISTVGGTAGASTDIPTTAPTVKMLVKITP